jgi:hypothetical protein
VAVALLFLIAIAIWASERRENASQSQVQITWQKLPALSSHLEIRRAVTTRFDTQIVRHFTHSSRFSTDEQVAGQS